MFTTVAMLGLGATSRSSKSSKPSNPGQSLPVFLYTSAKTYDPAAWIGGGERFPQGATIVVADKKGRRPLAPSFAASADATVSFDGKRVLFAGKQSASSPWQIWEIPVEGGDPHRITSCTEDCVRPFYLPEDRLVYAHKVNGRFTIEATTLTPGKPLPLTYSPGNFFPTDVLRDGRILFEAARPFGDSPTAELYTVYSDGSGVESYRCDHGHNRHSGKQIGSGDIVFVLGRGLARFTSALAHEVEIKAPAGDYAGDVVELPSGDWLVPWRPEPGNPFVLKLWKPGAKSLRSVASKPGVNAVQPVLLGQRPAPNRHPSGLHDWQTANLLCLNAYTSKYPLADGAIATVRLYSMNSLGRPQALGTAPVEHDGSFFLQIPADQPVQLELLDRSGRTLKKEAGWFWLRRGEQRVCVGCHAGPETAPENAVPAILLRSTTPADMTGTTTDAKTGGH